MVYHARVCVALGQVYVKETKGKLCISRQAFLAGLNFILQAARLVKKPLMETIS
jgi:hypothetical protein